MECEISTHIKITNSGLLRFNGVLLMLISFVKTDYIFIGFYSAEIVRNADYFFSSK